MYGAQIYRIVYGFLNISQIYKCSFFIAIFLCKIGPYSSHDMKCKASFQVDQKFEDFSIVKNHILKWWKENGINSHKNCKTLKTLSANSSMNIENLLGKVPEIVSFPCENIAKFRPFYFTGEFKDNKLEGKGKLVFLNSTTWKKLSISKQKQIQEKRICFELGDAQQVSTLVEIVGRFSNGSLNGRSKLTYTDGSFSLSNYASGKRNGYHQMFNYKGYLYEAGIYTKGFENGHHWRKGFDHIIYQDKSIVANDRQKTIVFPLLSNGSLDDPILGDYYHYSGVLENAYKVKQIYVGSKKSDCGLNLEYQVGTKVNYSYSLRSKEKFSTIDENNTQNLLCNVKMNHFVPESSSKRLTNWFELILNKTRKKDKMPQAHDLLLRLKTLKPKPNIMSVKLISDFVYDKESKYMTARILGSEPMKVVFQYKKVELDSERQPHGYNDIFISPNQNQTIPKEKILNWVPRRIVGRFSHGLLNGSVMIQTNSSSFVWTVVNNGVLHGPCIISTIKYTLDTEKLAKDMSFFTHPGIGYLGYYKDSKPFGTFWAGMLGGVKQNAFLHGNISAEDASISGNDIAYIYPDMETVLYGKFENRKMIDAQEAKVLELDCDENGLLFVSKFSTPKSSSPHFFYDPPTNVSFGGGPEGFVDPYERKWLELRAADNSKMGEGIYAKKDFKDGELIASYVGFVFEEKKGHLRIYEKNCGMNLSKSDDERRHCTKYSLRLRAKDAIINIPPDHDQPGEFIPSLGPKVNHDFRRNSTVFSELEHPRWGAVMGVYATKDIAKGEEVFANYDYGHGYGLPYDHPWYWELKRQVEKEERKNLQKQLKKS